METFMRTFLSVLLLSFAATVTAAPVITGFTPQSGPTTGGTVVTIMGSGFSTECPVNRPDCIPQPPRVFFGDRPATNVTLVNASTIIATTPPYLPGLVRVTVQQNNGEAAAPTAFRYEGGVPDDKLEKVLIPLLTPDVHGVNGSLFRTSLTLVSAFGATELFGIQLECSVAPCRAPGEQRRLVVEAGAPTNPRAVIYDGTPGRFIYVARGTITLAAHLRVRDVTRESHNIGTEVPVVHEREFRELITLVNDPSVASTEYRSTLRIYSAAPMSISVQIDFNAPVTVNLRGGDTIFDPAYAAFSAFPTQPWTTIRIRAITPPITTPFPTPLWAFATLTNNDTQMITTITPQP
jgi:hypothetical protein